MTVRKLKIDPLTRVEGEGVLSLKVRNGQIEDIQFQIVEPPRFFEAVLRGRMYSEAPDVTARICGICPVAYQMSAVHAMEQACGVVVDGQLRALRRLLYCGEWIESHVLHIFMLHAPDFLGYPDSIRMAKDFPAIVQRALKLKKAGNSLMTLIGGREIHPVNVRVGGFYRVMRKQEFADLVETLKWARDTALESVQWVAGLPFPDYEQDYEFVALRHPDEYPINEGRLISNKGLDISVNEYEDYFREEHRAHSTALYSTLRGCDAYLVGPLARYNLNFDKLSPLAQEAARSVHLETECRNPFKSILVRCIEVVYACDEALRIIEEYEQPSQPAVGIVPRAAVGYACTEAPRGILYHRYRINESGEILEAKIVPPTSQNQKSIENDLKSFSSQVLHLPEELFVQRCEQTIRNYDPCISCSTHFLRLQIEQVE
jgi:sulfhydrogenase subunit alpha